MFSINGVVPKQNVKIWGAERPDKHNQGLMKSPGAMMWCSISKERVIGSYILKKGNLTGESYRNMLIIYAFPRFVLLREDYFSAEQRSSAQFQVSYDLIEQQASKQLDWEE